MPRLSPFPQPINANAWYYENPRSITVVYEIRETGSGHYIRTDQFNIPWSTLEKSYKRRAKKRPASRNEY